MYQKTPRPVESSILRQEKQLIRERFYDVFLLSSLQNLHQTEISKEMIFSHHRFGKNSRARQVWLATVDDGIGIGSLIG